MLVTQRGLVSPTLEMLEGPGQLGLASKLDPEQRFGPEDPEWCHKKKSVQKFHPYSLKAASTGEYFNRCFVHKCILLTV